MKRFAPVLVVLACALPGSACLRIDTAHVLYLSPDGAVTWTVREHDVHSDEQDPARRAEEEADFLRALQEGRSAPQLALEALGGTRTATVLTRAERPWEAVTTARFKRIDALVRSLLQELGIDGTVTMATAGDQVTLQARWSDSEPQDNDSVAIALIEDLAAYRLVLTDGRFVSAEGFAIAPDGRTATFIEPAAPSGGQWLLSLTWSIRQSPVR